MAIFFHCGSAVAHPPILEKALLEDLESCRDRGLGSRAWVRSVARLTYCTETREEEWEDQEESKERKEKEESSVEEEKDVQYASCGPHNKVLLEELKLLIGFIFVPIRHRTTRADADDNWRR